jgi:hypothetical protein
MCVRSVIIKTISHQSFVLWLNRLNLLLLLLFTVESYTFLIFYEQLMAQY